MPVFLFLLLQYESFHTVFSAPESMDKRLRHCIRGRIPKVDAVRDGLSLTDPEETKGILTDTVSRIRKNGVLRGGTIGGYVTAAIDGVELFCSRKKSCEKCLSRKTASGEVEYFHKSIVCATVGSNPHLILGMDMLGPRDGAEKDEGELTGGKRLIETLYRQHGHFADVIVADALYLNAPFLKIVRGCHMDAVIRMKEERRLIYQDAKKLFESGEGRKETFYREGKTIDCWDLDGFEMEGFEEELRVVKYRERNKKTGEEKWVWLATTGKEINYKILWKMMHKRWDIEENAFHQLKTYYHAKHCYCHGAVDVIFTMMLIAFNIREMYLYRRIQGFERSGITRKSVTRILRDDLQVENMRGILYAEGG